MFNPGQGPRMSSGRKGFHGWSLSLTSFADVSAKGPGGGGTSRIFNVGMIDSSCSSERPESEAY